LKDVASGYTWNTETAGVTEDLNYPDISELQPGIYYVVYQDDISGDLRLFVSGLGTRYWLPTAIGVQKNAKVSGPYVVYQDDRNGNWDIYMTMIGYGPGAPHPPTPTGAMNNVEMSSVSWRTRVRFRPATWMVPTSKQRKTEEKPWSKNLRQ
jgi:beta propeller repeat protein